MEHRNSVLIVEDDVNINGLLKEALEKEGYICTQRSDRRGFNDRRNSANPGVFGK